MLKYAPVPEVFRSLRNLDIVVALADMMSSLNLFEFDEELAWTPNAQAIRLNLAVLYAWLVIEIDTRAILPIYVEAAMPA